MLTHFYEDNYIKWAEQLEYEDLPTILNEEFRIEGIKYWSSLSLQSEVKFKEKHVIAIDKL